MEMALHYRKESCIPGTRVWVGDHTLYALCSIWVSKMISFPGYQTSCSRAVWRWEGSSLGTVENFARIVSIFLTLQAPSGRLKNGEV